MKPIRGYTKNEGFGYIVAFLIGPSGVLAVFVPDQTGIITIIEADLFQVVSGQFG